VNYISYNHEIKKGSYLQVNNILKLLENKNEWLYHHADEIVQRKMVRLLWSNVYLISAQTEVKSIGHLYALADYIRRECNRVVILTLESEFTHLVVATSNNVCYLNINETLSPLIKQYNGYIQLNRDESFIHVTFYKQEIVSEVIDRTIESIIVDLPYL
jgi:hypothetical protein